MRQIIPISISVSFVLLMAFLWFALYRLDADVSTETTSNLVGKPVPPFRVENLYQDNDWIDEKSFSDQMFAINFFASWCVPCRAEHPLLGLLDVPIIGIAWKDKDDDTKNFVKELGKVHTVIGRDFDGEAMVNYGILGIPETIIVGKNGKVAYHRRGVLTLKSLQSEILPLIEKNE